MKPVDGKVEGAVCPTCNCDVELEGPFYEGKEVECDFCESTLVIQKVTAVYTVKLEDVDG